MHSHFLILFLAIVFDFIVGDPDMIWRRWLHPVVWFGQAISYLDDKLNNRQFGAIRRQQNGMIAIVLLLSLSVIIGLILNWLFTFLGLIGFVLELVIVAIFIAQKSLYDHVARVRDALSSGDMDKARFSVSMIVGRDPNKLNESDIARAGLESLAENFSDGVVAPIFWYAVLGLPGILAYKMLNTADSMIGHLNETYKDFGWASAKLDDVANFMPARLSSLCIAAGALVFLGWKSAVNAAQTPFRDAKLHRSPNAGWPEAAMAGALDVRLAGPRQYSGYVVDDAYIHETGRDQLSDSDLTMGLKIMRAACCFIASLVAIVAIFCL